MKVTEGLDIDFSLIIPTRERLSKLKSGLLSFFDRTERKDNNEAIILADHDDTTIRDFSDFILDKNINAKIILVRRSEMTIRDYNNYGTQCSLGKYIWMLNDDFEMINDKWDTIIKKHIEDFCERSGDRCAYVMVDDSTHGPSGWNSQSWEGCCCPILTRETCEAMNGIMPWQINSWGADRNLFWIFRTLPVSRILDLSQVIRVLHHSRHNKTAELDEVARRVERISKKQNVDPSEMVVYINRLIKLLDGNPEHF